MKVLSKPEYENCVLYSELEQLLLNFGVKKTPAEDPALHSQSSAGQPFTIEET